MRVWIIAPALFSAGVGAYGAAIAHREFYRALLTDGRADEYVIFTSDPAQAAQDLATLPGAGTRVRLESLLRLPHALREGGCDLLHATSTHLYPLAHLRQRYAVQPFPICTTILGSLSYYQSFPELAGELWAPVQPYDCQVFPSEASRQAWQAMLGDMGAAMQRPAPGSRQKVIPYGVDTDRYRPRDRASARARLHLPPEGLLVLSLARLSPYDKADLIPVLMAFEREVARRPGLAGLRLVVAGDDRHFNYGSFLEQYAALRGIQDRIIIVRSPDDEDVPWLYAACDLFIAPYDCLQENFGMALIEALAAGLPLVASDWGPLREIVTPGETGELVPTCWAPCVQAGEDLAPLLVRLGQLYLDQSVAVDAAALWQAVIGLAEDPGRRSRMAEQARLQAEAKYAWPVIIARYQELWQSLCQAAAARPATTQEAGQSPLIPRYFSAYRHYPRHLLDERSEVRLTKTGWEYLPHVNLLTPLVPMMPALSLPLAGTLAGACRDWTPVGRLLADQEPPLEAERRLYHVLWLLKYGLLEHRPAPGGEG